ncbi:hypothetical protein GCM10011297_19980 [Bacterioplanes sanyensis]|uniref:DUF523 domain-containing protein n=1 Tax=Bacterioplanes sanyensis TaxID=1249553 RepID=UPI001673BCE7|nr:DUF523 domain-containing protein [Bacterioplanes sanyensis]GGY47031.1 hypothetical protein GCM10011297_19980 [Bacterioplanes sanyensis]
MTNKILVSACLMGQPVRYDGRANDDKVVHWQSWLQHWQQQQRLVIICPEVAGGLPTPRPAAEIHQNRVIASDGQDFTKAFESGARQALKLAQQHQVAAALLADRSPSCGSREIYDGEFSGRLIQGQGLTAALLSEHGIACYGPETFAQLLAFLKEE